MVIFEETAIDLQLIVFRKYTIAAVVFQYERQCPRVPFNIACDLPNVETVYQFPDNPNFEWREFPERYQLEVSKKILLSDDRILLVLNSGSIYPDAVLVTPGQIQTWPWPHKVVVATE